MTKEEFQHYFDERYLGQLNFYDASAIKNQKTYNRLKWMLIILSALTPLLVTLESQVADSFCEYLEICNLHLLTLLTIFISFAVAIGTAVLSTFKYQENWISYRKTWNSLIAEQYFHLARVGNYKDAKDPDALFVERVENILSIENTNWLELIQQVGNDTDTAT